MPPSWSTPQKYNVDVMWQMAFDMTSVWNDPPATLQPNPLIGD